MEKDTVHDFINKSIKIHKDSYDYSKVNYINSTTKVNITCKIHGDFLQTPKAHKIGNGCPSCHGTVKRTIEEFINEAIKIHGVKFDYSKVLYENTNKKVTIICKKHGEFKQTPTCHLYGQGCKKCYGKYLSNISEFIEKANKIHNSKFTYFNAKYINSQTKLNITCKTHGDFSQKPNDHLMGYGCPGCSADVSDSKGVRLIKEYLNNNNIEYVVEKRFNNCKDKNPLPFDFEITKIDGEKILLEFDGSQHFTPKWGGVEYFKITQLHDKIKNEYCIKNNIKLIRIKYTEIQKINNILDQIYT